MSIVNTKRTKRVPSNYIDYETQTKKKKSSSSSTVTVSVPPSIPIIPPDPTDTDSQPLSTDSPLVTEAEQIPIFKDQAYVKNKLESGGGKRTRVWKNLKQIVSAERTAKQADPSLVSYSSLDAPPSLKPVKKYSDITGIEAHYMDPQSKLRYANTAEYSRVRLLPSDITAGLLALRKALPQVT